LALEGLEGRQYLVEATLVWLETHLLLLVSAQLAAVLAEVQHLMAVLARVVEMLVNLVQAFLVKVIMVVKEAALSLVTTQCQAVAAVRERLVRHLQIHKLVLVA
jgi:hypothetical protein